MKIVQTEFLINAGGVREWSEWNVRYDQILRAIQAIEWPPGSGSFTLYDQPGKRPGEGNGVKPIKEVCMQDFRAIGLQIENRSHIGTVKMAEPIDSNSLHKTRYSAWSGKQGISAVSVNR